MIWQKNMEIREIEFFDCAIQLRRVRRLQQDAEFEDKTELAEFYKTRVEHFQSLLDQGVEYEPNF
jgi:hypothetical protein